MNACANFIFNRWLLDFGTGLFVGIGLTSTICRAWWRNMSLEERIGDDYIVRALKRGHDHGDCDLFTTHRDDRV